MRLLVAALAAAGAAGMELRVSTSVGSRFLDKKVDLSLDDGIGWTIGDVKKLVAVRFPGQPPASLQRLFLGSRLLRDDDPASGLAEEGGDAGERIPLVLDVVPPVAAGRSRPPDDLEDRLKAYAAEVVALEHARRLLADDVVGAARARLDDDDDEEDEEEEEDDDEAAPRGASVAGEIRRYEATLLATVKDGLAAHAAKVTSGVVADGRGRRAADPRKAFFLDADATSFSDKLALGLDMNWRESLKVTGGLVLAANVGVQDKGRKAFLLSLAPFVFLAQTRPARFLLKAAWYLLPRGPAHADGFFNVLLNAPQQMMLALDEDFYKAELFRPLVSDAELAETDGALDDDDDDDDEEDDDE